MLIISFLAPLSTTLQDPPIKTIAPASTVLFIPRSSGSFPSDNNPLSLLSTSLSQPLPNIPPDTPYSDLTTPSTIVVISQPAGQSCAVVGGIMAQRIKVLGAQGIVVDGRVRDLGTLRQLNIPVWKRGISIVGAGAETKAWSVNVPVEIGRCSVASGDIIMIDPIENGIVAIPRNLLDKVLEMLPSLVAADEKVMADVEAGKTVAESFKLHRGK